jgi:hypothetical protein
MNTEKGNKMNPKISLDDINYATPSGPQLFDAIKKMKDAGYDQASIMRLVEQAYTA